MQTGGMLLRLLETQTSVPMQHVEPHGTRPATGPASSGKQLGFALHV